MLQLKQFPLFSTFLLSVSIFVWSWSIDNLCHGFLSSIFPKASSTVKHDGKVYFFSTTKASTSSSEDFHSKQNINTEEPAIQVFDNVFSSYACEELVCLTQDHSERGNDGSSVFTRPPYNKKPLTPIEHAIDSFLSNLKDTTRKVEYWSRDEYINIDAHADIDEEQLQDDDILRCPQMGHVLYLQVEEGLRGPTCVFPTKRFGWGKKRKLGDNDSDQDEEVDLFIVPAIKSRVLRFPGNAIHSVPRPPNRYFLSKSEENKLRQEEDESCREEDNGDNFYLEDDFDTDGDFDDDDCVERSVLLFNTWPDDEASPKGVDGDYITGSLPEGIELSEEDSQAHFEREEEQRLSVWEEEYGINGEKIRCKPKSAWECIEIETANSTNDQNIEFDTIRIGLMGNKNRRLCENKFVNLSVFQEGLVKAFMQSSTPTFMKLKPIRKHEKK